MDWLNNLLPEDFNYWIVVSVVLAVWSVYQYAEKHGLTLFKKHVEKYGHEPDGKVLVPKEAVVATPPIPNATAQIGPGAAHFFTGPPPPQPAARRHAWEK